MAKLFIKEYSDMAKSYSSGPAQVAQEPSIAEQTVAVGGGSLQSAAFNGSTRFIRVHTDTICSIAYGPNPTATTDNMRLAAGQTEYFGVSSGAKIAVIANT